MGRERITVPRHNCGKGVRLWNLFAPQMTRLRVVKEFSAADIPGPLMLGE